MIPGLELVPLEESEICCGAAGTYNLTQPEMSERLGRRKMDHIAATGAEIVATGNVGCILQIARKIKETRQPDRRSSTRSTCSTAPTGALTRPGRESAHRRSQGQGRWITRTTATFDQLRRAVGAASRPAFEDFLVA